MILFHGSKRQFNKFDYQYIGTGEGANHDVFGFWFLDNIYGAGNHAEIYVNGPRENAVVYVCKIPDDKPVLTRGIAVSQQPYYELWNRNLPIAISAVGEDRDWYDLMFKSKAYNHQEYSNKDRLHLLYEAGFVAIHDFELGSGETRYHGNTTLVMDVDQIKILDIIHTRSQKYEQLKYHCQIALGLR